MHPCRNVKYRIEQYFFDGWSEAWPYDPEDDIPPDRYETIADAQEAIDAFLSHIGNQIKAGEREPENGYHRDEFRIVPVSEADTIKEGEAICVQAAR
jgi:hypothetical protein